MGLSPDPAVISVLHALAHHTAVRTHKAQNAYRPTIFNDPIFNDPKRKELRHGMENLEFADAARG